MSKTVHLTPADHEMIGRLLVDEILFNETFDELQYQNCVFVFSGKPQYAYETRATGVEFLGAKETFLHTNITVEDFALEGVYDENGEKVVTDLDIRRICLDHEDDDYTVTAHLKRGYNRRYVKPAISTIKKQRIYVRPMVSVGRRISA